MEQVRIPVRADDPPHLLLWSADEILPIVFGLGLGILVNQVLICVVVGIFITNQYKRFRDSHADGYLMHLVYAYGFGFSKSKTMINPFIHTLLP